MTHTALSATGALRRAAECVLMAFGVPVTRDMPVDAVFLATERGCDSGGRECLDSWSASRGTEVPPFATNPANGVPMLTPEIDVLGNPWGSADDR